LALSRSVPESTTIRAITFSFSTHQQNKITASAPLMRGKI